MKFNSLNLKILSFKKRLLNLKKTKMLKSYVPAAIMIKNYFKYRKVVYQGRIGNVVRNDFDHKKKNQDLFLYKTKLNIYN